MNQLLVKVNDNYYKPKIYNHSPSAFYTISWIYIPPYKGKAVSTYTNVELGRSNSYQLYDLKTDPSQKENLFDQEKEKLIELQKIYNKIINN